MAPQYHWKDPPGVRTVTEIVKKLVPQWKNGLYPAQLNLVVRILDGEDIFCSMATGGGKSALFAVPILVLKEMARHPELYPSLPVRALPVGIVITPTKGLAANIVLELQKLDIPAFSYCHETVTEARIAGRKLVDEIAECKTWNVICVDPEHLRDKSWRNITASDVFCANIVYGCVDEAHLINQWGAEFRPDFKHIGSFFRGRLPPSASIMALSATVQPGPALNSICTSLGFSGDNFYMFRSSNERPNIQFIMEPLKYGVGGKIFPHLLPYLNSGRKCVIHCRTIAEVVAIFVYLWKCLPPGPHRLRRIKMYHALRSLADNPEILRLLDEDPECQVIISTIAFGQGMNPRKLLDSISNGMADEVDQVVQEKGRVGRDSEAACRGIVFFQPSALLAAEKQLAGVPTGTSSTQSKSKKQPKPIEHAKVLLLTEKQCYTAVLNRIYDNPPIEISTLGCIATSRRFPCSLCATRNNIQLDFPAPPLPPGVELPLFTAPLASNTSSLERKLRLTKKERETVEPGLITFGQTVYRAEHKLPMHQHRPKSSYFPSSLITSIVNNLLALDSIDKLEPLVESWAFSRGYLVRLYAVVHDLRMTIVTQREEARFAKNAKQRASRRAKAKKVTESEPEEDDSHESNESDSDDHRNEHRRSSPIPPPPKRPKRILKEVTNEERPARTRAKRKPQQRVAEVAQTFAAP
ncbi:P-loop containing nucleoside triphosphate hydrolase protein [Mycena sanguinolenta]|uniref:P-loop containing nucleoside triphosphate hydrolase protein n=1 Tax=Mycena sanguinolenta TaxID=230812 RepID=A0A8H6XM42_9AGAR|nr:P-loop containing nucleoside triphosphate hydrolase protein [Mycena sanguinolenta]